MSSSIILASSGAASSGAVSSGAAPPLAASFGGALFIILVIAHERSIISTRKKFFSQVHLLLQCGNIIISFLHSIYKILDFFLMLIVGFTCCILQINFTKMHLLVRLQAPAHLDL